MRNQVTPYLTDRSADSVGEVQWMVDIQLLAGRHVAYIERDASVDYLVRRQARAAVIQALIFVPVAATRLRPTRA